MILMPGIHKVYLGKLLCTLHETLKEKLVGLLVFFVCQREGEGIESASESIHPAGRGVMLGQRAHCEQYPLVSHEVEGSIATELYVLFVGAALQCLLHEARVAEHHHRGVCLELHSSRF